MEVMIDWSSSCGYYSDTRKRMQQMVSRANVPRTMMSATRLTEPEKKELDWESRREQRKLELQQFEARREKWRLEFQQLLRNIISESVGEVAVVDNESNRASLVEEVDLQYEARRHQSEARFQEHMQQSIAAMDLDSDSRESHSTEGEVHMNTDHDPVEVAVTPLQKTEEMELSMPLPHNWKSTEVNGIDSKSHVLSFSHNSAYYSVRNSARDLDLSKIVDDGSIELLSGGVKEEPMMLGKDAIGNSEEFGNYSSFSLQFCLDAKASGGEIDFGQVMKGMELEQNQLKQTECLSHARQNAPVRELSVVLPFSACYSLSLSWLLNWFPRPMVKLKFMAQHDEEMDKEGNVQWVLANARKDQIYVVVLEELGWFIVGTYEGFNRADALKFLKCHLYNVMCDASHVIGNFHPSDVNTADQQDFGSKEGEGGLKLVKKVIMEREKHGSIVEEKVTRSVKKALIISGNEFDSSNSFYQPLDVASFVKSSNLGDEMIENLGKQLDLDKRRGLCVDECHGVFKFAEDAAILPLCGFSKPKNEPKATASSLFLMHSTFASEDLLHFETNELNVSLSPIALEHLVQQASKHFGNVEEMANKLDNLLEDIARLGWFLASSYASSSNYRSLKRLSVRFPMPMVKMKPMKYVGRAWPKSWRWVNSALRLPHKCLLTVAFDVLMRVLRWIQGDQWLVHWRLEFLPSLRTRKL